MLSPRTILAVLGPLRARLDGDVSLAALAERAGWSRFHFHRAFRRTVGETPRQYTERLRLDRAAAGLAGGDDSVLRVALANGFGGHEVFARAFRRRYGRSPTQYRDETQALPADMRTTHARIVAAAGPCLGLFKMTVEPSGRRTMPMLSIQRQQTEARPILFIRRRVAQSEIGATIGQCLGKIFAEAHPTVAGWPFTRYPEAGPGLITIEVGVQLAAPAKGVGEIEAGTLWAGPVAMAVHAGPYETLRETYGAIERWMGEQGSRPGGPPWEVYVTDPAEHPDPADWRTEIYWPLAE